MEFQNVPLDLLPIILQYLASHADFLACCKVNLTFYNAAIPLLYRTFDSRNRQISLLEAASPTLLKRPQLAEYVRHVTEGGGFHPTLPSKTLHALACCKNLQSFTWIDEGFHSESSGVLPAFLSIIRGLSLQQLVIRTHCDLEKSVWQCLLTELHGLRSLSVWTMHGPPEESQWWHHTLGKTLNSLELGLSSFTPPSRTFIARLPHLRHLRLKGAPESYILGLLSALPLLESLDVDYLVSATNIFRTQSLTASNTAARSPLPKIRHLTVRASSMDQKALQRLWGWIRSLIQGHGLETFKLHAFGLNASQTVIPRLFLLDLAQAHGETLKHLIMQDSEVSQSDLERVCPKFTVLETLAAQVLDFDLESWRNVIRRCITIVKLQLSIPLRSGPNHAFTAAHAEDLMKCSARGRLRIVVFNGVSYEGNWAYHCESLPPSFTVNAHPDRQKWV